MPLLPMPSKGRSIAKGYAPFRRLGRWFVLALAIFGASEWLCAQTSPLSSGSAVTVAPRRSPVDIPQTNLAPISPGSTSFGGSAYSGNSNLGTIAPSLGAPGAFSGPGGSRIPSATATGSLFDPYSTSQTPGYFQPAMPPGSVSPVTPPTVAGALGSSGVLGAPTNFGTGLAGPSATGGSPGAVGGPLFGGLFSRPASAPMPSGLNGPVLNRSYGAPPPIYQPQPVPNAYSAPGGFGSPVFPSTIYPSGSPSTLFPGGLFGNGFGGDANSGFSAYRFLQGPRLRHAYLGAGDGSDDVAINDTDVSFAFAFPNFMYSSQPLYVVPSFSLHLWDGPLSSSGADLPARAYSGFLDFGWQTDPNRMFGVELGVRVGAFTAFNTFRNDSIRVLGKGLGSFRLTPATTLKVGVYYLDRNNWKLIPAAGLLWQPNPYTRFDLFFPQPKIARYCRTIGTYDVWGYLSGDYGGGSWTIKRANNASDSVDINDLRVMAGLEWGRSDLIRLGRRTAFVEIGYVFDREVKYDKTPLSDFKPDDAIMIRAGFGY